MSFLRANLRKIPQQTLPVLCELFNSRYHARQSPHMAKISRDLTHLLHCDKIAINTMTPSGVLRVVSFYMNYSYQRIVVKLKEHFGRQQEMFMIKSPTDEQEELKTLDLIREARSNDNAMVAPRIHYYYLLAAAVGIGLCICLANFHNISDLLKFSMRLENTLRENNAFAFMDPSQRDTY